MLSIFVDARIAASPLVTALTSHSSGGNEAEFKSAHLSKIGNSGRINIGATTGLSAHAVFFLIATTLFLPSSPPSSPSQSWASEHRAFLLSSRSLYAYYRNVHHTRFCRCSPLGPCHPWRQRPRCLHHRHTPDDSGVYALQHSTSPSLTIWAMRYSARTPTSPGLVEAPPTTSSLFPVTILATRFCTCLSLTILALKALISLCSVDLGDHNGTSITWNVGLSAGTQVILSLVDANEDEAWSGTVRAACGHREF